MKKTIIIFALAIPLITFFLFREIEYKRTESPDRRHYLVISYHYYNSLFVMPPGSSGDKPGRATIYTADGHNLGSIPLPMMSLASDIEWEKDKATIRLIGEWDLINK